MYLIILNNLVKNIDKYNIKINDINICLDYDMYFNDWKK